jgi:tetratricopeptide (TPR) repeat protein
MSGFVTKDVARLLGISEHRVRSFARQGFLTVARGARGEYRYSFHDVVVLRAAKELLDARVPPRKVLRALNALKRRLPLGRALSAVRIAVLGDEVLVRDSRRSWHPESGQLAFDFTTEAMAEQAASIVRRNAKSARDGEMSSSDWYRLGLDLESVSAVTEAKAAYRKAIALQPNKAEAHINLGRLLHEQGLIEEAEFHYRLAMEAQPEDATAPFNLGIALEDLCRMDEAAEAYRRAIEVDPDFADAHYNLAHLYERSSERAAAIRHLARYKALTKDAGNGI